MTVNTTITCDLEGSRCHGTVEKPYGTLPDKWKVLQGKRRIDLCPSCVVHVKRQIKGGD
ncbi:hypothetical protein LCGC14_1321160 [marine sediment metagenome]|uniref:Uncharacterized protein n=1 Tax=marine sediment metagenome TaxID=412755 RepID=A0A0F9N0A8_9ZZZZ